MTIKSKTSFLSSSRQPVRYMEFVTPLPLAACLDALRLVRTSEHDSDFRHLMFKTVYESEGVYSFVARYDEKTFLQGYLKTLADDTTLVSVQGTAYPISAVRFPDANHEAQPVQPPAITFLLIGFVLVPLLCGMVFCNHLFGVFPSELGFVIVGLTLYGMLSIQMATRWEGFRRRDRILTALQNTLHSDPF